MQYLTHSWGIFFEEKDILLTRKWVAVARVRIERINVRKKNTILHVVDRDRGYTMTPC